MIVETLRRGIVAFQTKHGASPTILRLSRRSKLDVIRAIPPEDRYGLDKTGMPEERILGCIPVHDDSATEPVFE